MASLVEEFDYARSLADDLARNVVAQSGGEEWEARSRIEVVLGHPRDLDLDPPEGLGPLRAFDFFSGVRLVQHLRVGVGHGAVITVAPVEASV